MDKHDDPTEDSGKPPERVIVDPQVTPITRLETHTPPIGQHNKPAGVLLCFSMGYPWTSHRSPMEVPWVGSLIPWETQEHLVEDPFMANAWASSKNPWEVHERTLGDP